MRTLRKAENDVLLGYDLGCRTGLISGLAQDLDVFHAIGFGPVSRASLAFDRKIGQHLLPV